ncbi:MAG: ribosome biogenesis GTP-binding protein YihA/YsxC [Prevotellaceae bacterium]|jgi:GTP-binding protein|nr:ribosome biogenesis GTP-binding protein YihA/YsxC [Prevotellaceae bacterium]
MIIHSAIFVKSSEKTSQCPSPSQLPEYAFAGRSNVGKSSLINMLTGFKGLSKVSGTPGKTKLANHFLINDQWYLVDLPGYGYAQASKKGREGFSKIITGYIQKRNELTLLFVLIDSRLEPQKIDLDFIYLLGEYGIPFALVFTKADKISASALKNSVSKFEQALMSTWEELPRIFTTSSTTRMGAKEVLDYIEEINNSLK